MASSAPSSTLAGWLVPQRGRRAAAAISSCSRALTQIGQIGARNVGLGFDRSDFLRARAGAQFIDARLGRCARGASAWAMADDLAFIVESGDQLARLHRNSPSVTSSSSTAPAASKLRSAKLVRSRQRVDDHLGTGLNSRQGSWRGLVCAALQEGGAAALVETATRTARTIAVVK